MKKHILFSSVVFAFMACTQVNSNSEKTITQGEDTLASVEISTSKVDALNTLAEMDEEAASSKLLFKATGTEPGWLMEISEFKIRLIVDYGKDSLILDNKGALINENEDYKYSIQDKDVNKSVSINAIKKPCTAASGDVLDRQVNVLFKGKTYKGCGSFVK